MIQWGYNVGCHQQYGDMFWFIQLVIPFYILCTNGIACFIDDVNHDHHICIYIYVYLGKL